MNDAVPPIPSNCSDFDFLLGEWDATITVSGFPDPMFGRWEARHLHGGRMIEDKLDVRDGSGNLLRSMATLRTWVPQDEQWACCFLYALEPPQYVDLRGVRVGDEFRLTARDLKTDESARVLFGDITDNSFTWSQHNIQEDGSEKVAITIDCTRA